MQDSEKSKEVSLAMLKELVESLYQKPADFIESVHVAEKFDHAPTWDG